MKHLKTTLAVIGSIGLLTALMLAFLEPPGHPSHEAIDEQVQPAVGTDKGPKGQSVTARALEPFYRRISQAEDGGQFKEAAAFIREKAPAGHVAELMEQLLERWAGRNLNAALAYAAGLENEQYRDRLLKSAFAAAGRADFGGAVAWLDEQSFTQAFKQALLITLYQGPADNMPGVALQYIDRLSDGEFKRNMINKLVGQWAREDTAAALSWLNAKIPLSARLRELHESLFADLLETNFSRAGELIQSMPVSDTKHQLARRYVVKLAERGIPQALEWARTLNDPESYRMALSAGYEAWLGRETDKTVILEALLSESDSGFRNHLINEVALDIAAQDPATLGELVDQLPPSAQGSVAEKVVRFWKERAPEEAAAWVGGLEPGPAKDRASAAMVEHYTRENDRERVVALAGTIEDNRLRYQAAKRAAAHWYQTSPRAAQALLDRMSFLSDAERKDIYAGLE